MLLADCPKPSNYASPRDRASSTGRIDGSFPSFTSRASIARTNTSAWTILGRFWGSEGPFLVPWGKVAWNVGYQARLPSSKVRQRSIISRGLSPAAHPRQQRWSSSCRRNFKAARKAKALKKIESETDHWVYSEDSSRSTMQGPRAEMAGQYGDRRGLESVPSAVGRY